MKNCPNCNGPIETGTTFCQECDKKNIELVQFCNEDNSKLTTAEPLLPKIHITNFLRSGWRLFKLKPGGFLGFTILFILISIFGMMPFTIVNTLPSGSALAGFITAQLFFSINGSLIAGYYIVAFKLLKNESVGFGSFFSGFRYFIPITMVSLISNFFIGLGYILFILPGIYLSVGYLFTTLLILDKKMGWWDAMGVSREMINKHWFSMFGFILIIGIINIFGQFLFIVGLIITLPVTICSIVAAYDDIVGIEVKNI